MLNSAELELGSVVSMDVAGLITSGDSRLTTRGEGDSGEDLVEREI